MELNIRLKGSTEVVSGTAEVIKAIYKGLKKGKEQGKTGWETEQGRDLLEKAKDNLSRVGCGFNKISYEDELIDTITYLAMVFYKIKK